MLKSSARSYLYRCVRLYATRLQVRMEYRADFLIGLAGALCLHATGVVLVLVALRTVGEIGGWGPEKFLLTYGLALIPRGIAGCLADGVWRLGPLVRTGNFDQLLTRPVSPLLLVLTFSVNPAAVGDIGIGIFLVVMAGTDGAFTNPVLGTVLVVFTAVTGAVISVCMNLIFNSVAFWDPVGAGNAANSMGVASELAKYPAFLYDRPVRLVVTFGLPFASLGYLPAKAIVGDRPYSALAGIVATVGACCVVAGLIWRRGLRRYESPG